MSQNSERQAARDAVFDLVDYTIRMDYDRLPAGVADATVRQILDTLGVALAAEGQPGARELQDFAVEMGGRPEAQIWGTEHRLPAHDAARVNATRSHSLDYDDTHGPSLLHPAVITVPAALAVAELNGTTSGRDVITAVATGVDVAARLACAARPGVSGFEHGWHNTTLYGFFAATLVSGRLLGLSRAELVSALGIAYHQASGNSQAHVDGALTKRMGPGFATYGGILAARLAQRGVRGATHSLEGVRGFFFQYHGSHYSREILLDGLGAEHASTELSLKPWPSCRGTHTAVDAALRCRLQDGSPLDAAEIDAVTVFNGPGEYPLLADPVEAKRRPESTVAAQFSVPWVVAAALVDGRVSLEHFTQTALERSDLLAMTARVKTVEDPGLVNPAGGPGAARVEVTLRDGTVITQEVRAAKGDPVNPMQSSEVRDKFFDCTRTAGMSADHGKRLLEAVEGLQTCADVRDVIRATHSIGS